MADAPSIFVVTVDSSYNGGNTGDGGTLDHEYVEVDVGCVVQQILLESSHKPFRKRSNKRLGFLEWKWRASIKKRAWLCTVHYSTLCCACRLMLLLLLLLRRLASSSPSGTAVPSTFSSPSPLPTSSPSSSQTVAPSPSIPELIPAYLAVVLVSVAVFSVLILRRHRFKALSYVLTAKPKYWEADFFRIAK